MLSPYLLSQLIIDNTDQELLAKKEEVLKLIQKGGIENFISNENPEQGFGSYNILKEEYILLVAVEADFSVDEPISIQKRIIEEDEISYRVLAGVIELGGDRYLLEIGRSLSTIEKIEGMFFQIAMGILFLFLALSFLLDSAISKRIMAPFNKIK